MTTSRAEQKRLQQQQRDDWAWLASTPNGRRILRELLGVTGFLAPGPAGDVVAMAVAQGQRNVGAYLYARFTGAVDPALLPAILADVMMVPPSVRERSSPDADPDADPGR